MGCGSVVSSSLVDRLREEPAKPKTPLSLEVLELWPFDTGWWSLAVEFLRWNMRRRFSHGLKRFRLLSATMSTTKTTTFETFRNVSVASVKTAASYRLTSSPIQNCFVQLYTRSLVNLWLIRDDDEWHGIDTLDCLSGLCYKLLAGNPARCPCFHLDLYAVTVKNF